MYILKKVTDTVKSKAGEQSFASLLLHLMIG